MDIKYQGVVIEVGERRGGRGHAVKLQVADAVATLPVSREDSLLLARHLYGEPVTITVSAQGAGER